MARIFLLTSSPITFASVIRELDHTYATFDLRGPWWNLSEWIAIRRAMRDFAPDGLHCVGLQALRVASVLNRKNLPFVYSSIEAESLNRLTRRIAAKGTALVHTNAERERFARIGLRADVIPLGISEPQQRHPECDPASKVILFGGTLNASSDPRQAAWAFDVLKYAIPNAQLVFPGDGPLKKDVQELSYALGFDDYRVQFVPECERLDWMQRADVVWVTHPAGGAREALTALAHGLPVVAMRTLELDSYASEGMTLVPAGDRVTLASNTLKLLHEPRRAVPMPRFPFSAMVEKYAAAYDALAGTAA